VQKLGDAGIASVADSLKLEESEVADILESSGYTTYKHRCMLFNMNFSSGTSGHWSSFLSCWIYAVILFLLLLSCLAFYVLGITFMLGCVHLALSLL
jgi:hypothetical protein